MRRAILLLSLLALLWCAMLIENASAAGPSALPATYDGSVWNSHFKGERPVSNPRITRDLEFALRFWNRHGTPTDLCRPRVLTAPSLDGALGAAEPRGTGYSVGCTFWLSEAVASPHGWSERTETCHTILHEVGHLGGLGHSKRGIMDPEFGGGGFRVDRRGRWNGSSLCEKRVAAERNKKVFAGIKVDGRFDLR